MLPCEEFFLGKIELGLNPPLTTRERELLLTRVAEIVSTAGEHFDNQQECKQLDNRCVNALAISYELDLQSWPSQKARLLEQFVPIETILQKDPLAEWYKNNKALYDQSERTISGIVQHWYLTTGRTQELKASGVKGSGCLGSALVLLAITVAIIYSMS